MCSTSNFLLALASMKIKCPSCQSLLNIPDSAAGKVVKCPCGKQLRAPGGAPAAAAPDSIKRPAGAPPARPMTGVATRPASRAAGNDHGFDAAMFDELTSDDLAPVRSVSNPSSVSMAGGSSATGNKLRQQYGSSSAGGGYAASASNRVAGVGKRIGGAVVDGIFVMIGFAVGIGLSVASVAILGPPAEDADPFATVGFWVILVGAAIPTIINYVLVSKSGQTLGKKMVGTVIVDKDSGVPVGFGQGIFKRSMVFGFITGIPIVGPLIALVDIGFLFTEEHQTLHDRLANTLVVEA